MRDPIPKTYRVTQEYSAAHKGLDIAPLVSGTQGYEIVAPEQMKITGSVWHDYGGNYVVGIGQVTNTKIYFGHLASRNVKAGQIVPEGHLLGIMGYTGSSVVPQGKYGTHTHMYTKKLVNGSWIYFNPRTYLDAIAKSIADGAMTDDEIKKEYRINRGVDPTANELTYWRGRKFKDLSFAFETENNTHRAKDKADMATKDKVISDLRSDYKIAQDKVTELQAELEACQNKPTPPPIEIEKPIEVPPKWIPTWLLDILKKIFNKG